MEPLSTTVKRDEAWQRLGQQTWDMLVIGGGITGAGIALEATRAGLSVLLVERQDFAWGTSSRSSKMVHGGLRYMAQGDIQTTRHSVQERELLLAQAPGLVDLMHYAMPHYRKQFPPAFLFNALLLCYDVFARKRYRRYFGAKEYLATAPYLEAKGLVGVTQFADAVTDDSRLVMRVLHEAQREGALCLNYVAANRLHFHQDRVVGAQLENVGTGETIDVTATVVVNASGAWADELRAQVGGEAKIRPARGSHIIVPHLRLPVSTSFTILHPQDRRPIFVYPWLGATVIGTTDIDNGKVENREASISQSEFEYLLQLVNAYFPSANIRTQDVISSFAGVRPLISSGALTPSKEKRNHSIWLEKGLISVSGGKLTTFRLIALDVLKAARPFFPKLNNTVKNTVLFHVQNTLPERFLKLSKTVQRRLLGCYGLELGTLLAKAEETELEPIGDTPFLWAELRFSATELVVHLDDLLLRRTRLGLLLAQGGLEFSAHIQRICQQELHWDDSRWQQEVERYQRILDTYYRVH